MSKFDLFCKISITIMFITFIFGIPMIHHSIHIVLYLFDIDMTLTKIYGIVNYSSVFTPGRAYLSNYSSVFTPERAYLSNYSSVFTPGRA